jgi:hypothetical protein
MSHNMSRAIFEHGAPAPLSVSLRHVTLVTEPNITYNPGRESLTLRSESLLSVVRFRKTQRPIEASAGGAQPLYPNVGSPPLLLEVGALPFADRLGDVQGASVSEVQSSPHQMRHDNRVGERGKVGAVSGRGAARQ